MTSHIVNVVVIPATTAPRVANSCAILVPILPVPPAITATRPANDDDVDDGIVPVPAYRRDNDGIELVLAAIAMRGGRVNGTTVANNGRVIHLIVVTTTHPQ
jgi:hypothetical protein